MMIHEQSDPKSDKRLSTNTMRCKKIHFEHFKKFIGKNKRMLALNQNLIDAYRKHLFNDTNDNVTKNNYLKSIKTFICWCKKKGFIKIDLKFEKFPTVIKPIITLKDEELSILQHSTLPKSERQQVDIFLLGCYTALSIGDLIRIKEDMIINDELHIYRHKTEYKHCIPLIPQALEILRKYDFNLPHIHPNKSGIVLKKAFERLNLDRSVRIVKKVGYQQPLSISQPLNKVISWHKARKTAITLALADGVNPIAVQQLSGHLDHRSFSRYIDKDILLKNELMQKFRKVSKSES
jgi:integrase